MTVIARSEKRKILRQKSGAYLLTLPKWWLKEVADYYDLKMKELKELHVIALEDLLIVSVRNKKYVFEVLRRILGEGGDVK
jgi:hypothetical protein